MTTCKGFFKALSQELAAHRALNHPFLLRFSEAALSREQLAAYAVQHYLYSRFFTRNVAAVIASTPDERARSLLIQNLYEEIGEPLRRPVTGTLEYSAGLAQDLTHGALLRRFLRAVGLNPLCVETIEPLPETAHLIAEYRQVCHSDDWLAALGALGPGTECVVPTIYAFLEQGMKRSRLLSPEDYLFWTLHVHCDDGHGENILEAMAPFADTEEAQRRIAASAHRVLDARAVWLDGLMRLLFGAASASADWAAPVRLLPSRPIRLSGYLRPKPARSLLE